ncbi:unknown [Prevotella sp. CAG:873]|nr:unknown [Prevotella sp. CAG:873]
MLHDVVEHSFLFFLTGKFVYYIAVRIDNIGVFGIGCDDERAQIAAAYVAEVAVVVSVECRLLCEVDRHFALLDCVSDKCCALTAFAHAGHITDDKGIAFVHLVYGKRYRVYLLGGKIAVEFFLARIAEFINEELVNVANLAEALL